MAHREKANKSKHTAATPFGRGTPRRSHGPLYLMADTSDSPGPNSLRESVGWCDHNSFANALTPKCHDIKIEATRQNIITLGDGNQIDAKFGDLGQSLAQPRTAMTASQAPESAKLGFVADIDTFQSQLSNQSRTQQSLSGYALVLLKNRLSASGAIRANNRK
jgi:hypothetical protein